MRHPKEDDLVLYAWKLQAEVEFSSGHVFTVSPRTKALRNNSIDLKTNGKNLIYRLCRLKLSKQLKFCYTDSKWPKASIAYTILIEDEYLARRSQ